jgi:hypothetical protein
MSFDTLDTAFLFTKLLMVTGLAGRRWIEQRTAVALRAVALGMLELVGRMHAQADGTQRSAIGIALIHWMSMLIERNGGNTSATHTGLIGVPGVEGSISGDMDGKGMEHGDRLDVKRHKVGDVVFVEGQGGVGQHHIAVDRISGGCDAGAVAPDEFLFFCGGAVGLHLVGALFDAAFGNQGRLRAAALS